MHVRCCLVCSTALILALAACGDGGVEASFDASVDTLASIDAHVDGPDAGEADALLEVDAGGVADGGSDATAASDSGPDCGPHGEAHGDHCDCHRGYVERDGQCERLSECEGEDPLEPDDIPRDAQTCDALCERSLCPGDRDHVLLELEAGAELHVRASFEAHDALSLSLYEPGADPRFDSSVSRSDLSSGGEFSFTARRGGAHLLRVSGDPYDATGVYLLEFM